jgi:hypothetical protein
VIVNTASAGKGVVDAEGESKVPFTLPQGTTEMDSNVFVDTCDTLRKVLIVDRNRVAPPPAVGCDRKDIPGIFWVRPVNTIVVDVGTANPSLLLVRGAYTPPKPTAEGEESAPAKPLPKGLMMFAGGAYTSIRDAAVFACGTAQPCTPHSIGLTYTFGASFWLSRFVGVEGTYIRPHKVTAEGGDGFTFKTDFESDVWTIAGKLGAQAGPVRIYGKGGLDYHQATTKTVERLDLASQTFEYKTTGWSWLFGGGVEIWMGEKQRAAIYADGSVIRLKGKADSGGEAEIDDRLKAIAVGVKLRLGR